VGANLRRATAAGVDALSIAVRGVGLASLVGNQQAASGGEIGVGFGVENVECRMQVWIRYCGLLDRLIDDVFR